MESTTAKITTAEEANAAHRRIENTLLDAIAIGRFLVEKKAETGAEQTDVRETSAEVAAKSVVIRYKWLHGQNHQYKRGGRDYGTSRKQKRNGSDSGDSWKENLWGIALGNCDLLRPCRVCVGLRSSLSRLSPVKTRLSKVTTPYYCATHFFA